MVRQCPKCGAIKNNADMSATEACPECGAIYSKAKVAAAQERVREQVSERVGRTRVAGGPGAIEMIAWALTVIGSLVGIVQLAMTITSATGAPQQAAGAALAVASAVVPYCLARAIQLASRRE